MCLFMAWEAHGTVFKSHISLFKSRASLMTPAWSLTHFSIMCILPQLMVTDHLFSISMTLTDLIFLLMLIFDTSPKRT